MTLNKKLDIWNLQKAETINKNERKERRPHCKQREKLGHKTKVMSGLNKC
jgi:hypothetical protein